MRRLITAIALLISINSLPQQTASQSTPLSKVKKPSEENRKANPQTNNSTEDQTVKSPDVICDGCAVAAQASEAKKAQDHSDTPRGLYRVYLWATIVGVFVGLIGLGFIYWQIRILKQTADATQTSANAAQKSAEATLLNAKAMIQTERPWIVVSVRKDRTDLFDSFNLKNRPEHFSFHIKNVGRTPAEILHITVFEDLIPRMERIPDVPPCKNIVTYIEHSPLLAPEEPWQFDRMKMSGIDYRENELRSIQRGTVHLLRYGIITYRNTSDPDKSNLLETKFCCIYDSLLRRFDRLFIPNYSGYK